MPHHLSWLAFALGAGCFAGVTAIFGKPGVEGLKGASVHRLH